jgi:hypothetical protein
LTWRFIVDFGSTAVGSGGSSRGGGGITDVADILKKTSAHGARGRPTRNGDSMFPTSNELDFSGSINFPRLNYASRRRFEPRRRRKQLQLCVAWDVLFGIFRRRNRANLLVILLVVNEVFLGHCCLSWGEC